MKSLTKALQRYWNNHDTFVYTATALYIIVQTLTVYIYPQGWIVPLIGFIVALIADGITLNVRNIIYGLISTGIALMVGSFASFAGTMYTRSTIGGSLWFFTIIVAWLIPLTTQSYGIVRLIAPRKWTIASVIVIMSFITSYCAMIANLGLIGIMVSSTVTSILGVILTTGYIYMRMRSKKTPHYMAWNDSRLDNLMGAVRELFPDSCRGVLPLYGKKNTAWVIYGMHSPLIVLIPTVMSMPLEHRKRTGLSYNKKPLAYYFAYPTVKVMSLYAKYNPAVIYVDMNGANTDSSTRGRFINLTTQYGDNVISIVNGKGSRSLTSRLSALLLEYGDLPVVTGDKAVKKISRTLSPIDTPAKQDTKNK